MFLPSDIIMESATYGGAINASCHGACKAQVISWLSSLQRGACFVGCRSAAVTAMSSANVIVSFCAAVYKSRGWGMYSPPPRAYVGCYVPRHSVEMFRFPHLAPGTVRGMLLV